MPPWALEIDSSGAGNNQSQTEMRALPESEASPKSSPIEAMHPVCPACEALMVVQRIVPGHRGLEHWTFRCARCGQLHQAQVDIAAR
jgi:hypothetical protein